MLPLKHMQKHRASQQQAFTLVELLIVIVVIAILAAISIVAYNGMQNRARNSSTQAVVVSWIKALELYKVDNGEYPRSYDSCLGESSEYTWDFSGGSSGNNQCRHTATSYYTAKTNFMNLMRPYFNNGRLPTPDLTTIGSSSSWYRGASYTHAAATGQGIPLTISYALHGNGDCVSLSGLQTVGASNVDGGKWCMLRLGFNPSL